MSPPEDLENCIESKFAEKKRNIKSNESKRVSDIIWMLQFQRIDEKENSCNRKIV